MTNRQDTHSVVKSPFTTPGQQMEMEPLYSFNLESTRCPGLHGVDTCCAKNRHNIKYHQTSCHTVYLTSSISPQSHLHFPWSKSCQPSWKMSSTSVHNFSKHRAISQRSRELRALLYWEYEAHWSTVAICLLTGNASITEPYAACESRYNTAEMRCGWLGCYTSLLYHTSVSVNITT